MKPRVLVVEDETAILSPSQNTSFARGLTPRSPGRSSPAGRPSVDAARPDLPRRHAPRWGRAGPVSRDPQGIGRPDHHAHRARRGDRPDRRSGTRRRRLRRQAVQCRGARREDARRHARGRGTARMGPVTIGAITLDPASRIVTKDDEQVELAAKEFDLLHMLMNNAGQVVKRETIMDEVWDPHWFGPTKTLDVHISWLRKKLEEIRRTPCNHHGPRRRLPLRRHRGSRAGPVTGRRAPRRSAPGSSWRSATSSSWSSSR